MKRKADWATVALWLCVAAILMLTGNVIRKTVMIARMAPMQMEGTSSYIRMDVHTKAADVHASGTTASRVREVAGDCK